MLNIIGISLAFLGTILTLITTILSKSNKQGTTYAEVKQISPNQHKNKVYTICGLIIMAIGFLLQLIAAIQSL